MDVQVGIERFALDKVVCGRVEKQTRKKRTCSPTNREFASSPFTLAVVFEKIAHGSASQVRFLSYHTPVWPGLRCGMTLRGIVALGEAYRKRLDFSHMPAPDTTPVNREQRRTTPIEATGER
jgi:hypothetical protein